MRYAIFDHVDSAFTTYYQKVIFLAVLLCIILAFSPAVDTTGLAGKWYNLERDTSGYVFYEPCDGRVPYIAIDKDKISVAWQLDDPYRFKISKVIKPKGVYEIEGKNKYCSIAASVRWIDKAQTMALWKFKLHFSQLASQGFKDEEFKWVMCPAKKLRSFKDLHCEGNDTLKVAEKVFLPVTLN